MLFRIIYGGIALILVGGILIFTFRLPPVYGVVSNRVYGRATVADRLSEHRDSFDTRLLPALKRAGVSEKPKQVTLVFFKDRRELELYAADEGELKLIKTYRVLAASGDVGPKLREGDKQVPEGIYKIEALNPNSSYHLSLRVNYPNSTDLARPGRARRLGGDIMIHGSYVSIGCIAIGDDAIEEIFVLAALTEYRKWRVILAPKDLRVASIDGQWADLYKEIASELKSLPASP